MTLIFHKVWNNAKWPCPLIRFWYRNHICWKPCKLLYSRTTQIVFPILLVSDSTAASRYSLYKSRPYGAGRLFFPDRTVRRFTATLEGGRLLRGGLLNRTVEWIEPTTCPVLQACLRGNQHLVIDVQIDHVGIVRRNLRAPWRRCSGTICPLECLVVRWSGRRTCRSRLVLDRVQQWRVFVGIRRWHAVGGGAPPRRPPFSSG